MSGYDRWMREGGSAPPHPDFEERQGMPEMSGNVRRVASNFPRAGKSPATSPPGRSSSRGFGAAQGDGITPPARHEMCLESRYCAVEDTRRSWANFRPFDATRPRSLRTHVRRKRTQADASVRKRTQADERDALRCTCDDLRCHATTCDALRCPCDDLRCHATTCDAMRRPAMLCDDLR